MRSVSPKTIGQIPAHPLDRVQDLFFLNAAEHFTAIVAPQTNEDLLIAAASPYLAAGGNRHLLPIFEAAHSVMLAVFSAPSNVEVTTRHLPFYVDALFKVCRAGLGNSPSAYTLRSSLTVSLLASSV